MKKNLPVLFFALSFSLSSLTWAQETVLLNFTGPNGNAPFGSLIRVGNKFFGMVKTGGVNNDGCVFSIDTDGSSYKDLWDFKYLGGANGAYPYGSLTSLGNKLYGMTESGGLSTGGTIFSIDTDGSQYKDMVDLSGASVPEGTYPYGNLTLSGGVLYGMTQYGGANNKGIIFSVDTDGTHYTDKFDFGGLNGEYPLGTLTLSGTKLYGITQNGGANGDGDIFMIDTTGTTFHDMFDFSGANGSAPRGSLTLYQGVLYGMTFNGGASSDGIVFSIDTNGNNFKDLYDFNGIGLNGKEPWGDLYPLGSRLFGMTEYGGIFSSGVLFSIDTNGTGYKDNFDFNTADGDNPSGSLLFSNGLFYGMTSQGGLDNEGVVFSFDTTTPKSTSSIQNIRTISGSISVYPNPSNGVFTIAARGEMLSAKSYVEVYNVLGEQVYSQVTVYNPPFIIDLSSQPNGVYFYKVMGDNAELIGEGKLVIQK